MKPVPPLFGVLLQSLSRGFIIRNMHVVIFEGSHWRTFAPLSLSRPVFMLATGMTSLLDKQLRHTRPSRVTLWVRPELEEFALRRIAPKIGVPTKVNAPLDEEMALLISGRSLHLRRFAEGAGESVVVDEGDVIRTARVKRPGLSPEDVLTRSPRWLELLSLPRGEPQTRLVERLWDLIKWNEESLIEDFAQIKREARPLPAGPFHVLERDHVWVGPDVTIQPGAVLDASKGPIVIEKHAAIGANAVLQGPCFIGPYAQILPLSYIRAGTSISTMCKVGGEISNSILFGYSNKAHEGFLGDSYVGKWCNLGAGTTTSNLKNTYGEISVRTPAGELKTGRRFLGALIGDHAKTGIGTRLSTGSYVGFSSLLAGSAIASKFIASYSYWTDKGMERYDLEKAIGVMKTVFARRDRSWDGIDETVVRYVAQAAVEVEGVSAGGG